MMPEVSGINKEVDEMNKSSQQSASFGIDETQLAKGNWI